MSTTQTTQTTGELDKKAVVYNLQGTLLEACSCNILCPCWVGEDPDRGDCKAFLGYHFEKGVANGVDVSGLSMVMVCQIPGNVLTPKTWKVLVLVDERATDEQVQALTDAYTGKLGGPLADLAGLVGEIIGLERVPIAHNVKGGAGTLKVADAWVESAMEPYRSADGTATTLHDTIFSTVPGSPAYVSKASYHRVNIPKYGISWSFEGRNAVQSDYTIVFSG